MTYRVLRPRYLALTMYLAFMAAGAAFLFWPSRATHDIPFFWVLIWHIFLFVGSTISISGVLRRNTALEAIGIPLLIAALTAYSLILIVSVISGGGGARAGVAALLIGAALGLAGRMVETLRITRIAVSLDKRGEG